MTRGGYTVYSVVMLLADGRTLEFDVLAASTEAAEDIALEQAEEYYNEHPLKTEAQIAA